MSRLLTFKADASIASVLVGAAPAIPLSGMLLAHDSRAANVLAAQVDVALINSHVATVGLITHAPALKDLEISYSSRVYSGLILCFFYDYCADCDIASLIISNFLILIDFHVSLFFDYEKVHLLKTTEPKSPPNGLWAFVPCF